MWLRQEVQEVPRRGRVAITCAQIREASPSFSSSSSIAVSRSGGACGGVGARRCRGKSKQACKAAVDSLMTYLRSLDLEGSMLSVGDATHLVLRPEAPRPKQFAPIVMLQRGETNYQGHSSSPASRSASPPPTRSSGRPSDGTHRSTGSRAGLLRDQRRRDWDRVVAATQAASAAGFTHAGFVFAPPRTWVADVLWFVAK